MSPTSEYSSDHQTADIIEPMVCLTSHLLPVNAMFENRDVVAVYFLWRRGCGSSDVVAVFSYEDRFR